MNRMIRVAAASAAALALAVSLAGCGKSASSMTCQEYGHLSMSEKNSARTDLLNEHDLEPADIDNITGISEAVSSFCGVSIGSASRNLDRPLEEAADWTSRYW